MISEEQEKNGPSLRAGPNDPADDERMTRGDWYRVALYFIMGLFLLFVFWYMIVSGPKATLIAGITLITGIFVWAIFRYILKDIA